mgnify:FL=1
MGKSYYTDSIALQRLMDDLRNIPVRALKVEVGLVYGTTYYTVEPDGGNWFQMETWCLEAFGEPGSVWYENKAPEPQSRWYTNNRRFWFRDVKDRDWFVLRWNS